MISFCILLSWINYRKIELPWWLILALLTSFIYELVANYTRYKTFLFNILN